MVVISPTSNLPITKDSFTSSKINEESAKIPKENLKEVVGILARFRY
jgi:hypothetical protein